MIGDAPSDDDDEAEGGAFFMTEVDTDPNARTQTQETVNHGRESLPQVSFADCSQLCMRLIVFLKRRKN